mgnify:CR=1 FL=1
MNRTFKSIERKGRKYNILALPNTNFFKFEIINKYGSNIERIYEERTGKNVYGIAHFVEHLGFRATKDYTTEELLRELKNEGTYNASTNYDRINYWFQTDMTRTQKAINLVCNYALNDLSKIPQDEFEIERKVVFNEAKRYADDDQTMFYFDIDKSLCGFHDEDNVIGIPETIDTFTLEDATAIKDIFLNNGSNIFNITYDPTILTQDEVITMIEIEMSRFTPLNISEAVTQEQYNASLKAPKNITAKVENESEQHMTWINLDVVDNHITANYANSFIASMSPENSLNDLIREKNGLTYGVHFSTTLSSYKPYTYFACDVSKGTEDKLMELFNESINKVADSWNSETFEKFMDAKKLKRSMSLLDQKNYGSWHNTATWYPHIIEDLEEILASDLDAAYIAMEEKYTSEAQIREYLVNIKNVVNSKDFGLVTN